VVDAVVWAAIVAVGAMHYALALRADDVFTGDTTYFELARSLLAHGVYGFNARPETVVPPGFSLPLISSPLLFSLETRAVLSDLPYLFTSLVALLLVERLDRARSRPDSGGDR
jgi:hypothetical protein